jgi:hypothetical protein
MASIALTLLWFILIELRELRELMKSIVNVLYTRMKRPAE